MLLHGLRRCGDPVPKPRSTKLRLVINYRALNAQTIRNSMLIPHVRDVIARIGRFHAWSKADLKSRFWQTAMEDSSAPKTGCTTPTGLYMWNRMPMGICNGPPTFQRVMSEAIAAAGLTRILGCFLDDLATGGANHVDAAAHTGRILDVLKAGCLLAGVDKIFLRLERLPFLSFHFPATGGNAGARPRQGGSHQEASSTHHPLGALWLSRFSRLLQGVCSKV